MREDDVERQGLPPDEPDAEEPLPVSVPDSETAEEDVERLDREGQEGDEAGEVVSGSADPD